MGRYRVLDMYGYHVEYDLLYGVLRALGVYEGDTCLLARVYNSLVDTDYEIEDAVLMAEHCKTCKPEMWPGPKRGYKDLDAHEAMLWVRREFVARKDSIRARLVAGEQGQKPVDTR